MRTNSLDFEIRFYERIIQEKPDYVDALSLLAQAYTSRKQYQKGLGIDQRLARLCPEDPLVFYNLACSYALLGHKEEALGALEHAVALGYREFTYMLKDADLKSLHQEEKFQKLLLSKPKRRKSHEKLDS